MIDHQDTRGNELLDDIWRQADCDSFIVWPGPATAAVLYLPASGRFHHHSTVYGDGSLGGVDEMFIREEDLSLSLSGDTNRALHDTGVDLTCRG